MMPNIPQVCYVHSVPESTRYHPKRHKMKIGFSSHLILPMAVLSPVPITTPRALPAATLVPEKMMFFLSWLTALGSGTGSVCLMTDTDSPVRMDWSILNVVDMICMIRMSAGILSPTEKQRHQCSQIRTNSSQFMFFTQF